MHTAGGVTASSGSPATMATVAAGESTDPEVLDEPGERGGGSGGGRCSPQSSSCETSSGEP